MVIVSHLGAGSFCFCFFGRGGGGEPKRREDNTIILDVQDARGAARTARFVVIFRAHVSISLRSVHGTADGVLRETYLGLTNWLGSARRLVVRLAM